MVSTRPNLLVSPRQLRAAACGLALLSSGALGAAGCGGKAVIDATGGAGGTTTTTTTTTTTITVTDCDSLYALLGQAVAEAVACDPASPTWQCDGTAYVYDGCQCQILANEDNPDAIAKAMATFDAWVAQGCGPWDCDFCPPFSPGDCVAVGGGLSQCMAGLLGG